MPPREEHDGSDWSFRMIIEDRYKRLVVLRRTVRRLLLVVAAFVPLRTAWHCIPHLLTGEPVTLGTWLIFGLGVVLPLLHTFAFGFGKPHRERVGAIKVFGVLAFLLLAEVAITFYQYHIMAPKDELIPARLAAHFPGGVAPLDAAGLKLAAQVFEAVLDVVGLAALIFLALGNKEYVLEKRAQKKEGAAKRD